MKLEKSIDEKEISYNFHGEQRAQTAKITFRLRNISSKTNGGEWEFKGCDYDTICNYYTVNDWMFLKAIANKIEELKKQLKQ